MKRLIVLLVLFVSSVSFAGLSRDELKKQMMDQGVPEAQAEAAAEAACKGMGKPTNCQQLPLSGVLTTHGFNGAFFIDSDKWNMNASIRTSDGRSVLVPHVVKMRLKNGGIFKLELAYKWLFVFLPESVNILNLDGAIFGRGPGFSNYSTIGGELGVMGSSTHGGVGFYFGIGVGIGGTILNFPRMEFAVDKAALNKALAAAGLDCEGRLLASN